MPPAACVDPAAVVPPNPKVGWAGLAAPPKPPKAVEAGCCAVDAPNPPNAVDGWDVVVPNPPKLAKKQCSFTLL